MDIYIYIKLLRRLAYMVIEAEKSQDLPSTSWRTMKAGGIIQCESEGLRIREDDGVTRSLKI